jgi:CDP-4-dehydro-6-deoxyglucose reductase
MISWLLITTELDFMTNIDVPSIQFCDCQVAEVNQLTSDLYQVELMADTDVQLSYLSGQYLELNIDDQVFPFSIANAYDSNQKRRLELLISASGHFSQQVIVYLKKMCKFHNRVQVTLPKGECYLQTPIEQTHIMIAFGSGFSQMKCLVEEMVSKKTDVEIDIYWSNRNAESFCFLDQIEIWLSEFPTVSFTPILEESQDEWPGEIGVLSTVIKQDFYDLKEARIYLCGSPTQVYDTIDGLIPLNIELKNCFSDVFSYAPRKLTF